MATRSKHGMLRVSKLALAVSLAYNGAVQATLPGGAQVAAGSAQIATVGNTMTVTNSPSAIINWQSFSIGASHAVRFAQQSASSSVLNRVVGGQMSAIMGRLSSNGQVFLINPAGVLVGAGAVIDTASFFASTLKILDQDFLAGKLQFQGDADSGKITNQGWIRTGYGGNVVLMAPDIENSGIIQAPGGKILLAAGQKVTLGSLDMDGLGFEVQAPSGSALNLGQLIADGGVVKVFAGSLKHSGDIRANSLTRDSAGEIVLQAKGDVELTAGSTTLANGRNGGTIRIESETGTARVAGVVSATGRTGAGGGIDVLGEKVVLTGNAALDASGATAGGVIRAGGDWQGANPDVKNAQTAFVGSGVTLMANATDQGDGGKIVVWSDADTRYQGSISARGGPNGGHGGEAEVSGKGRLLFTGTADLTAPRGSAGSLLLDPIDLFADDAGGLNPFIIDEATDFPANAATVSPATLAGIGANVTLYASRDMRLSSPIMLAGFGLSARADRDLQLGAAIGTGGGALSLSAGRTLNVFNVTALSTADGSVTLGAQNFVNGSLISVEAGTGSLSASTSAGALQLGTISSGTVNLSASGGNLGLSNITSTGAVTLSGSSQVSANAIATGGGTLTAQSSGSNVNITSTIDTRPGAAGPTGGSVTITAPVNQVDTRTIQAGDATVALSGTDVSTNGFIITTTGNVGLTATAGDVNAIVNDAAGVTASAVRNNNVNVSVNLSSTSAITPLNATSVNATTGFCSALNNCRSATVTLSGQQGVNVGTVSASAQATSNVAAPFNSKGETVSISSTNGSIRAMAGGGQVTATDVTLSTTQGTGGGIGMAGAPINVNNARTFTFSPNGEFNVALTGSGPNRLTANVGVAAPGSTYNGTLTKAGQINLNVSANDTTVTANSFSISGGFNDPVFNQSPLITLRTPNGALTATNVSVPAGDVVGRFSPFTGLLTIQPLDVTLRASGNLVVSNYTRAAGSVAKTTTFSSDAGSVTLGTVAGNLDAMTVTAPTGANITSLATAGHVVGTSSGGSILVDSVSSSAGNVTLTANNGVIAVLGANNDGPGVEITASAGAVTLSANRIGTAGFTNPMDILGNSVSLTTTGAGTYIGSGTPPNNAVTATTTTLTINAAGQYNVTSPVDLTNLTVTASPSGVGFGGIARVTSNVTQYNATSDVTGTNFTLANWTAPALQFASGTLSFTSVGNANVGDITLDNIDFSASGGGLLVRTNHFGAGAVTQTGSSLLNLGTGALTIQANGAVALDTASFGSLSASVGNSSVGSAGRQVIGGSTVFGVASFSANTINANSGAFDVTSRGAINTGALPVGSVNLTAYSGGVVTGALGTVANPLSNATINTAATSNGGGDITTGVIEANNVNLTARANTITVGGAGTINAVNTGASSININNSSGAGTISVGAINANSVTLRGDGTITTGNINAASAAPGSIRFFSNGTITTGSLDATSIESSDNLCCGLFFPAAISVGGAIGGNFAGTNLYLRAGTLGIGGNVTLDPTQAGTVQLESLGGTNLTINGGNGVITAGDGTNFFMKATDIAAPLQFARVDAGANGTVRMEAVGGLVQTAAAAGNGGIRAGTVFLASSGAASAIAGPAGDANRLTLRETTGLTINAGNDSRINLTGGAGTLELTNLDITRAKNDAAFELTGLAGTQSLTVTDSGSGARLTLANAGAAPLNFSYTNNSAGSNIEVFGAGIATNGGSVTLNANNGNLLAGSIDSRGGVLSDGSVALFSGATLTVDGSVHSGVGSIMATAANDVARSGAGKLISTSANSVTVTARNGDIGSAVSPLLVDSPTVLLNTIDAGGTIQTRDVFATLNNTSNLTLTAGNGFIVSSDTALTDLNVTTQGALGAGVLTLTSVLGQNFGFVRDIPGSAVNLTGVTSAAPLNSLTFGVSTGNARVLGSQAANALDISATTTLTLDGTAPLTLINATSQVFSAGTITAQGTVSASTATQVMSAGTAINLTGNIDLGASAQQQLTSGGNLTFTGTGSLTSTGSQVLSTNGNQTYTAQGGAIAITAVTQGINGNGAASQLVFQGGNAAGESIAISGSSTQTISTSDSVTSGISFIGGGGANSSVTLSYSGAGTQTVQGGMVEVRGGLGTDALATITTASGAQFIAATTDVKVTGGGAAGASASITNTSALVQRVGQTQCGAFCGAPSYLTDNVIVQGGTGASASIVAAGTQKIQANIDIQVAGGSVGAAGGAKIENTNAATEQRIGCDSNFDGCNQFANAIKVNAGATGAGAQIIAAGTQRLRSTNTFDVTAGADANTSAQVLMNAAGGTQQIQVGATRIGTIPPAPAAGDGSVAEVFSAGLQTGSMSGVTLRAGAGVGALARMEATSTQNLSLGGLTLIGGANTGAQALLAAGSGQTLTNVGTVALTGGTGTTLGEASALVRNASGAQSLTGGAGVTITSGADFATAGISNQDTSQFISAGAVGITTSAGANSITGAGALGSGYYSGILQGGGGTQTFSVTSINVNNAHAPGPVGIDAPTQDITAFGAVMVQSSAGAARIAGATQTIGASGIVTVQVTAGTGTASIDATTGTQTIRGTSASTADPDSVNAGQAANANSANGGVRVQVTGGSGTARIANSGGGQNIIGSFVDVNTSAAGTAVVSASGDQWIHTTNGAASGGVGSLRVAAVGGGSATVSSDGSQLLQIDYPEQMQLAGRDGRITIGSAGATGSSLISAVNQDVFARSITVLGGAGAGANSKINVTGVQNISLVSSSISAAPAAGITIQGGAGGTALIDPVAQTIVSNGLISVMGGSAGTDVFGGILATGNQTILVTNSTAANGILVQGGGGANADGRIATSGPQTITVTTPGLTGGSIQVSGGAGPGADGEISAGGNQLIDVTTPSSAGGILVDGGGGSDAFGQITTAGNQTINVTMTTATPTPAATGGVEVQGGSGPDAVGQIAAAGTQYIFVSAAAPGPADILVEGGSGIDAFGQITAGSMLIGASGGIELTPGIGANADAILTSGQTIAYGCGAAFTCDFPVLPGDFSSNGIADFGGAPLTIQVDLATFTGAFPSSDESPLDLPDFLFNSLILWDPTLSETEEENERIVLGRRLPVCN